MPPPKDPKKLEEYKKKMSIISKAHGSPWKKGKPSPMKGKKHSPETIEKLKIINKENALKNGYGKWMKGRKLPHISALNTRRLKGKTYEEIYGDNAKEEALKRKQGNRDFWKGKDKKCDTRPKHNSDYRYVEWRKAVFLRDDYTCQRCKIKNVKGVGKTVIMHAHHLKSWSKHLELRYEIDNGITFCNECHKQHHKENGIL